MTPSTAPAHPITDDLARVALAIAVARGSVARGGPINFLALEGAVATLRTAAAMLAGPADDVLDRRLDAVEAELAALARELRTAGAAAAGA